MRKATLCGRLGFAIGCVWFGALLRGAEAPAERVVELPKVVVTDARDLPPPESWRHATIPGFEVLSNASDKATQRLLRDFDMFRQALGHVWPLPNRAVAPAFLIVCGRKDKFDAFVPPERADAGTAQASLFLKRGEQSAIVIDLQATTLQVLNEDDGTAAANGIDSGLVLVEHDKQLYREYVRYLLSRSEPRLPAWYEEGFAQIVMKMKFDRRWIEFARLEDPNTVSAEAANIVGINTAATADDPDAAVLPGAPAEDRDFAVALRRRALIPLDRFFAVAHEAPEASNPLGNNIWAKQAYAFVHMCSYGYGGKFQKAFGAFLARAIREPVTEAMFKDCFKMSYKDMLLQLRDYSEFTVYEHKEFRAKQDVIVPPAPVAFRDATQAEIGRIKGETLVLSGWTDLGRAEMTTAYRRGERDPDLLAALGVRELEAEQNDRARKFLEAAFAGRSKHVEGGLALARLRYADALAQAGEGGNFSPAQVADVIAPLLLVRGQPPRYALYDLMADTWIRSAVAPNPEQAAILIEGAQLFPARLKLVYQTARVCAAAGMVDPARALAAHGLKYAPDSATRARFEAFQSGLPPASAAAVPATKK